MRNFDKKLAEMVEQKNEVMESIASVHGERAAQVAESMASVMLMQKEFMGVLVDFMRVEKVSPAEIAGFVSKMQDPMTSMVAKLLYLMTDQMPAQDREDLTRTIVSFAKMIDRKAGE
jgi:hypothetical protein